MATHQVGHFFAGHFSPSCTAGCFVTCSPQPLTHSHLETDFSEVTYRLYTSWWFLKKACLEQRECRESEGPNKSGQVRKCSVTSRAASPRGLQGEGDPSFRTPLPVLLLDKSPQFNPRYHLKGHNSHSSCQLSPHSFPGSAWSTRGAVVTGCSGVNGGPQSIRPCPSPWDL